MPRESGASSTPRLLLLVTGASDYWIARSSRAMTTEKATGWLALHRPRMTYTASDSCICAAVASVISLPSSAK
jgi:hypothetical protein